MSNFFNPSVDNQNPQSGNNNDDKKRGFWSAYWRTAWLPGIGPRLKQLGWRLGHFAYLLALIYHAVRLIPAGHPVLNPVNIGKFGFRDVIGTAADNVKRSRENLDQVLMFFAVILGLVVIILQFLAIIGMVVADFAITQANAQVPGGVGSFFSVDDPTKDLALVGLEMVFGTDIFGAAATVTPIVTAFHALLAFFSHVMLIIAIIILLYYVIVVVSESAMTGTPFGRRFNGFWAPVRLVVAFGLLIPMANGLNTAQYVTLYAAKMGSNMASNGWALFTDTFFDPSTWVVAPSGPDFEELAGAIFVNELCAYLVNENSGPDTITRRVRVPLNPGNPIFRARQIISLGGLGYGSTPLENFDIGMMGNTETAQRNVHIYWTRKDDPLQAPDATCGAINVPIKLNSGSNEYVGSEIYEPLQQLRLAYFPVISAMAIKLLESSDGGEATIPTIYELLKASGPDSDTPPDMPSNAIAGAVISAGQASLAERVQESMETLRSNQEDNDLQTMLKQQGWAGAGGLFYQIAQINGEIYDAVHESVPSVERSPQILSEDSPFGRVGRFLTQSVAWAGLGNRPSALQAEANHILPIAMEWFANGLEAESRGSVPLENPRNASNILKSFASSVFASHTLFDMQNTYSANPLAQLSAGGKELMQKSMAWLGIYAAAMLATEVISGGQLETLAIVTSGLAQILITIGMTAGIILHFIIPLLPFMYFLFAIVGWISEIFEAIVAMPLWALAHIRIDGDGLPGQAASNGYYLIFGIFTRPIFILFGLIGGYTSFMAGVYILHNVFDGAISAMMRDAVGAGISSLGFTIMYVVIVYNLANTAFKMIDTVPSQIMRWLGSGAQGFNDGRDPGISNIQQVAGVAGGFLGSQAMQGMSNSFKEKMGKAQGREQEKEQGKAAKIQAERHDDLMAALGKKSGGSDDSGSPSGSKS